MKKQFMLGQNILWIINDNNGRNITKGIITELYKDHYIAKTCGNDNNSDDMTLWIDDDNEMEFFDLTIMETVLRI